MRSLQKAHAKHILLWLALVLTALATTTGCVVGGARQAAQDFQKTYPSRLPVSEEIIVGQKRIPLPPGDWVVVLTNSEVGTLRMLGGGSGFDPETSWGEMLLVNRVDTTEPKLIYLKARTSKKVAGRWMGGEQRCESKGKYHSEKEELEDGKYDCWWVNKTGLRWSQITRSKFTQDSLSVLSQRFNVALPPDLIYAGFYVTDSDDFVLAWYMFDQSRDSRKPEGEDWSEVDWAPWSMRDSQRKYLDEIINWGKAWRPNIQDAIRSVP